jgi:hypothetical protein
MQIQSNGLDVIFSVQFGMGQQQIVDYRSVHILQQFLGDRIGRMFSLGSFFEYYKYSPKFCATLPHSSGFILILANNGLGYILGDFFHKLIWSP